MARTSNSLTPARITVVRVAGDEMTDSEVFDSLRSQLLHSCELEISVKATEAQVDKAMGLLMQRVIGRREIEQIKRMSGVK